MFEKKFYYLLKTKMTILKNQLLKKITIKKNYLIKKTVFTTLQKLLFIKKINIIY